MTRKFKNNIFIFWQNSIYRLVCTLFASILTLFLTSMQFAWINQETDDVFSRVEKIHFPNFFGDSSWRGNYKNFIWASCTWRTKGVNFWGHIRMKIERIPIFLLYGNDWKKVTQYYNMSWRKLTQYWNNAYWRKYIIFLNHLRKHFLVYNFDSLFDAVWRIYRLILRIWS